MDQILTKAGQLPDAETPQSMKKLFGLLFFWALLFGFYYSPTPIPTIADSDNLDYQANIPVQKVTYVQEPLTVSMP